MTTPTPFIPTIPFEAPTSLPKTYTGVCKCQSTKFTLRLPSLTTVEYCPCRFCSLKDILYPQAQPGPDDLQFVRKGPTTEYEFAKKRTVFEFCSSCGNFICATEKATGRVGINVRLLEDVDFWALERVPQTGYSFDIDTEHPPFTGPPFEEKAEDAQEGDTGEKRMYYGDCHCGAVQVAIHSQPLTAMRLGECNCSWCRRWSAIHSNPPPHSIHISNFSALSSWKTPAPPPEGGWTAKFCGTCGTQMFIWMDIPVKDAKREVIEEPVAKLGYEGSVLAVDVRCLRLGSEEWEEVKGKATRYPQGREMGGKWEVR